MGLVDIAAGVLPLPREGRPHALAELPSGALGPLAAALSLGAGVLLLFLAHGLRRRGRRAWHAAVLLLPAGALAQYACRQSFLGALGGLASVALLALLLRHRDRFRAPPGPRSRWRALTNFLLMGAGSILVGLVAVGVRTDHMVGAPSLADRLEHVLYGLLGLRGPVHYTDGASWTVGRLLAVLGLLTAATTLHLTLRPERPAAHLTPDDEDRLRALREEYGGHGPPDGSARRRDTAVVFSPSGRAAVTYRVEHGVMLADGDPLGDVAAWPGAIERFMDEARAHSWTPAVTGCSRTGAEVWSRETGLGVPPPDVRHLPAYGPGGPARAPGPRLDA